MSWPRLGLLLLVLCGAAGASGCDRQPAPESTAPASDASRPTTAALRIISLAPALSQMIIDLGLGEQLVGVASFDDAAPHGLPVVGNFLEVNTERLLALRPTHVLTMAGQKGVPDQLYALQKQLGFQLGAWDYPPHVHEAMDVLWQEGQPSVGSVLERPEQAKALRARTLAQLEALQKLTADQVRPRVLLVLGVGPVMACGPGTVFNDLLVDYVGGVNAAEEASITAPVYDREKLLLLQPEVILLLEPNAPPLGDLATDDRLREFRGLDLPAVQAGRIALLNDPLVYLPTTTLPRVAAAMARAIHPQLADKIDQLQRPDESTRPQP